MQRLVEFNMTTQENQQTTLVKIIVYKNLKHPRDKQWENI